MKLGEAIELLQQAYREGTVHWTINDEAALKLGIEALKREVLFRERVPRKEWSLLPGETE